MDALPDEHQDRRRRAPGSLGLEARRHVSVRGARPPDRGAPRQPHDRSIRAVLVKTALRGEGAAAPKCRDPPRVGDAARASRGPLCGERKKDVTTAATAPARQGRVAHRRGPAAGLARPYRSGSGSPPQCCGLRTRTRAPPSSRQGTRRVSLTPRATSVLSLGRAAATAAATAWNRPERRRRGCWEPHSSPLPGRAAGQGGKKKWGGGWRIVNAQEVRNLKGADPALPLN